jgi:Ca2+-transporting ATPase
VLVVVMDFYREDVDAVLRFLDVSRDGLSEDEAARRLERDGANELVGGDSTSPVRLLLGQFKNFLIIILLGAAVVSAILGSPADAVVIIMIVVLAAILGFVQEYRAEKDIEALKRMIAPTAVVVRGGVEVEVPARSLVVGDIVVLRSGSRVPADCRLIDAVNLRVDESALTGESVSVEKSTGAIREWAAIGDRFNMVYMGTTVTEGRGLGIVVATGMRTEFGRIGGMLQEIEVVRTPLQRNLDRLGRWIGVLTLLVVGAVSMLGVLRGYGLFDMFLWGVALAVAAIPEALPAVVTVSLALGVRRMVKRHSLVRRLTAVETLGATTVICTDKTGTLTQNRMTVRQIYADWKSVTVTGTGYVPEGEFRDHAGRVVEPGRALRWVLAIGVLCNDSALNQKGGAWQVTGDPTEGALVVAAAKAGILKSELERVHRRIGEVPFSSERKQMTTLHHTAEGCLVCSKGAPEVIVSKCTHYLSESGVEELTGELRERLLSQSHRMAEQGLRVIALACKQVQREKDCEADRVSDAESELVFAGLVGMIDPPREEAKKAIETCRGAGIKTVMITGDHILTAKAVASELGLDTESMITGGELDGMSDEEFENSVESIQVYARTSPSHKLRIITALQEREHVVAMTGDGVNDAPALKRADIGIAMGITGTDVSKEAADMILTDDNFVSIVAAVEEGRNIFKNIRNFVTYGLAIHLAEVLVVFVTLLAAMPLPLIAIQILWINLITDGLPPLTLSLEPPHGHIMRQPPRSKREGIITKRVVWYSVLVGLLMTVQAVLVFLWHVEDLTRAQSMVFTLIVVSSMFNALNWRSEVHSVFALNPFANMPLLYAIATTILLQFAVLYTPLSEVFHTVALGAGDWIEIMLLSVTTLLAVEVMKRVEGWWRG